MCFEREGTSGVSDTNGEAAFKNDVTNSFLLNISGSPHADPSLLENVPQSSCAIECPPGGERGGCETHQLTGVVREKIGITTLQPTFISGSD